MTTSIIFDLQRETTREPSDAGIPSLVNFFLFLFFTSEFLMGLVKGVFWFFP